MVTTCCVPNCSSNTEKPECKGLHYYVIPSGKTPIEQRRRRDWIKAIPRSDWENKTDQQISNMRICSAHFVSGERSTLTDHVDWVPTVFFRGAPEDIRMQKAEMESKKRGEEISFWKGRILESWRKKVVVGKIKNGVASRILCSLVVNFSWKGRILESWRKKVAVGKIKNGAASRILCSLALVGREVSDSTRLFSVLCGAESLSNGSVCLSALNETNYTSDE